MAKKFKFTGGADEWKGSNSATKGDNVNAKGGDDILNGRGGDDTIHGGSGDDTINGGAGNDNLFGDSGDDTITSTSGNDIVDGGTGVDIVVLTGNRADATVTATADGYSIVTASGTVTIKNIETVRFADGDVAASDLIPPVGVSKTLTSGTDTINDLTAQDDTITGAAGTLNATDIILDNSSTDADVLNVTLTAINGAAKVAGVETINVTWDSFAAAAFDATNVTGANINLTSSKLGFLGASTITATGANTVTAGAGMTGTLTANGVTGATINATNSSSVIAAGTAALTDSVKIVGGATTASITSGTIENVTVTAGAATTTVTVTGYDTATIDAGKATTVALTDDAATDSASVKIGADAAVTLTGTGKLAIEIADGKTATVSNIGADLTVSGTGSVTVSSGDISANTVKDNVTGTFTLISTAAGAVDFSKADADLFVINNTAAIGGTLVSGDSVRVDAVLAGASAFNVLGTGTSDAVNATFTKSQTAAITFGGVETVNLVAAGAAVAGTDLSFGTLTVTPTAPATGTINLTGTNDVAITTLAAAALDATGLTGNLTVTGVAAAASVSVVGATGVNTVDLSAATSTAAFVGQNGNDIVTFGILGAGETATAVTSGGDDKVTVDASALVTGAGAVSIETGAGNDTVDLTTVTLTTGTIVLQGGDGTDTLAVNASDLSAANLTITGFEAISVTGATTFAAATLSGKAYTITGVAGGGDVITVSGTGSADTINLSTLSATDSASTGVSFAINGGVGNDTIVGTATNDTITGGTGVDTLTGGALADVFVIAAGDSGITVADADKITDFTTAVDDLNIGTGVATVTIADGSAVADFAALTALANATLAADDDVYVAYNALGTGNAYVFIDHGGVAGTFDAGDALVILEGVNAASKIVIGDFV